MISTTSPISHMTDTHSTNIVSRIVSFMMNSSISLPRKQVDVPSWVWRLWYLLLFALIAAVICFARMMKGNDEVEKDDRASGDTNAAVGRAS
jgi:hypothetical protein